MLKVLPGTTYANKKVLLKFLNPALANTMPFFGGEIQQTFFTLRGCVIDLVELKRWLYFNGIYFSALLIQTLDPVNQVIVFAGASAVQEKKKKKKQSLSSACEGS